MKFVKKPAQAPTPPRKTDPRGGLASVASAALNARGAAKQRQTQRLAARMPKRAMAGLTPAPRIPDASERAAAADHTRVASPKERARATRGLVGDVIDELSQPPYESPSALSSFQTREQMSPRDRTLRDKMAADRERRRHAADSTRAALRFNKRER